MAKENAVGWKAKRSGLNTIVGTSQNPTEFESGQVIINKKSTKKNLDKLIEINNDGKKSNAPGKVTNDATDGGLLKGPPHYDEKGKPTGGIPGIVDGGKMIETEGDEFVVNKEASEEHWKELSKINQADGNGVAINPPSGIDDDPQEYKEGGKIEFNPNKLPKKSILKYAEMIRTKHPEIWKLGGNIFGNQAFKNLKRVSERGYWEDSEEWMYIKWRSYVARHIHDFRIEGVVAMLKWVDTVEKGWPYMKQLIEEQIKKVDSKSKTTKMKTGGSVDNTSKSFVIFLKSNLLNNIIYTNIDSDSLENAIKEQKLLYSWSDIAWIKGFETNSANYLQEFFLQNIKEKWETKPELTVSIKNGKIVFKRNEDSVSFYFTPVFEVKDGVKIFKEGYLQHSTTEIDIDSDFNFDRNKIFELMLKKMKDGGSVAQTTAPKKDQIKGSDVNKPGSSATNKSASSIKFDEKTIESINNKVKEHNDAHPDKKITLASAKAVVRRGMGAYSSSHRPTITGGKPNSRTAWGIARLNAFTYKIVHGKSKSGKYTQDDDLINELGYSVAKYHLGGDMSKHLAPNGKPSNLTHEQWHLVRTPEFKAWFGDWENDPENASKVVDENGEPLVVWHGTKKEFTEFGTEDKLLGYLPEYRHLYTWKKNTNYFHKDKKYSKTFGSKYGGKEIPFFLKANNLVLAESEDDIEDIGYFKNIYEYYTNELKADAIYDSKGQYATLISPNQIKLSDGTNTTFDGNNPDIRFKDGGSTDNSDYFMPANGTLMTKDKKTKLDYNKVGNDYEFSVFDGEPNPVENYSRVQYKKRSNNKVLMNYNQFVDYLYNEGYIDDKFKNGGETMTNTEKLIQEITKNSNVEYGVVSTTTDGEKYRYVRYRYKNPISPNWLVMLYEKAAEENGKKYGTQFFYKDYSFHYDRHPLKNMPNGSMGFKVLEILPSDFANGGSVDEDKPNERFIVKPKIKYGLLFGYVVYDTIEKKNLPFDYDEHELYLAQSRAELSNVLKKAQGGPVDPKDTVTVDIPLMIRLLELSREDIHSDAELHMVVERLLDLKNKPVLTMDDYSYIAEIEHKHLQKMALGGNLETEKLISQAHTNLTVKKGRRDYAPTSTEIQEEIDRMIMEGQFGSTNI